MPREAGGARDKSFKTKVVSLHPLPSNRAEVGLYPMQRFDSES
jgi:hypothetical protein